MKNLKITSLHRMIDGKTMEKMTTIKMLKANQHNLRITPRSKYWSIKKIKVDQITHKKSKKRTRNPV